MPNSILAKMAVQISADLSQFSTAMTKMQRQFSKVGKRMQRVGKSMSTYVTLPLVGLGTAAVKLAGDFEASFAKIENLVGISADQVENFKKETLALSKISGKGPEELADALFVVTSAGLRGADALEVLERSAKASAVGIGDTEVIARATTAVMQAYGTENISAAEASDVLLNTIREGNLEASSFAPVLGRIIPIAADMAVGFDELGANVATFTRLGVDSAEAVTALRGLLSSLQSPSEQTKVALKNVGLSADILRKSIKEKGLARTLILLRKAFKGNDEELAKVIPNVRAFTGFLAVTGNQAQQYIKISDSLADSTGLLDEAFKKQTETFNFKMAKVQAGLKVLGIKIGNILLPIISKLIEKIGLVIEWFSDLSPAAKKVIVVVAGIVAVIGPLLYAFGKFVVVIPDIIKGVSFLTKIFTGLSLSMAFAVFQVIALTGVVFALLLVAESIYDAWGGVAKFFENVWLFMKASASRAILEIIDSVKNLTSVFGVNFTGIIKTLNDVVKESESALSANGITTLADVWSSGGDAINGVGDKIVENFKKVKSQVTGLFSSTADSVKEDSSSMRSFIDEVNATLEDMLNGSTLDTIIPTNKNPKIERSPSLSLLGNKKGADVSISPLATPDTEGMLARLNAVIGKFKEFKEEVIDASQVVQAAMFDLAVGLGESLADIATGQGDFNNFLNGILASFGKFVVDFGKLLIGYATAQIALKTSFKNPGIALAAGVALVAIGSVIKKLSEKGPEAPALATGTGFIPKDGLFNLHRGEAVIPKKFNQKEFFSNGSQEIELSLTPITIGGDRIQFVLDNYRSKVKRMGG